MCVVWLVGWLDLAVTVNANLTHGCCDVHGVCFKSAIISVLIARSHSDVNATAPCMSCTHMHMHFAQACPPMSCIPLVVVMSITRGQVGTCSV